MFGPAALPYLRPPLGCLSRIHTPTLDKTTGKTTLPTEMASNSYAADRANAGVQPVWAGVPGTCWRQDRG
jgi:hypothetical protein